ncbi:hypothetical protein FE810_15490 [Thalassotalea litorea]|uniref:Uncharacterized protein n=1 Tax=Thalassotalea litorea TaxID=2020715 RepID=A0A5R9ICZ0_9GAMM|nr:hypothetical protein [Thalassotalea litorea]TLU61223.1 hypothetical protein FE810_15490 [Thalassotalea litorea]
MAKFSYNSLKILLLISLVTFLFVGAKLIYEEYERNERLRAELNYMTKDPWQWHDESRRIQIKPISGSPIFGSSTLRKVNMDEYYVIVAYKNEDHSLTAGVIFLQECEPNRVIDTSRRYSDGEVKQLSCSKGGKSLRHYANFNNGDTSFVWSDNLDGFKFRVNFAEWDFSRLDKEITLSKAKPNEPFSGVAPDDYITEVKGN